MDDWYTRQGLYNLSDGRQVLGVSCEDYRRHGAFAEYVAVPQHILYRVPDSVSFNQAAMVEPISVSLHAFNLTPLQLHDSAVVVGSGIIGLFMVQILRAAGCSQIIAIDLEDRAPLWQCLWDQRLAARLSPHEGQHDAESRCQAL